jgi:hypothetical protein
MCPTQLSLCVLTSFIMFCCFINSSNSLFVVILQSPLTSLFDPNIFLNIFSQTRRFFCKILTLRTHLSQL